MALFSSYKTTNSKTAASLGGFGTTNSSDKKLQNGPRLNQQPTTSTNNNSPVNISNYNPWSNSPTQSNQSKTTLSPADSARSESFKNQQTPITSNTPSQTNYKSTYNSYNPSNYDQTDQMSKDFLLPEMNIAYPDGGLNNTQNFSPISQAAAAQPMTSPAVVSAPLINPYDDQLKALKSRIDQINSSLSGSLEPTDEEKEADRRLKEINSQLKNLAASEQLGIAQVMERPIALQFQTGQVENIKRNAAAQAATLEAQTTPLRDRLAQLQADRQGRFELGKYQLGNLQNEYQTLQEQAKPKTIEVDGNIIEYSPTTGQSRVVFSKPMVAGLDKPIEVSSGATLVDPRTGRVIYSSPGTTTGKVTDDISEFNLAKSQGFKGNFVDFKRELANLKEQGSSASSLPASYKEYQLSQTNPGYGQYLNQAKTAQVPASVKSDLIDMGTINKMAGEIKNLGESNNWSGVGFGTGTLSQIASKLGYGSQESQNLRNFIGNLNGTIAKLRGGTSFTDSEKKLLETYTPTINDSPNMIKSKIDSLQKFLNFKTQSINEIYGSNYNQNSKNDPLGLGFSEPLSTGLNGSIKTQVAQKYPTGVTGGQCGDFAHKLVQFPSVGDGKLQKFRSVDKFGVQANDWRQSPRVGDVLITDENPTYGHVAVVNEVLPNGTVRLSESNFRGKEKVSHDRVVSINSPKIYGAIRGQLKV